MVAYVPQKGDVVWVNFEPQIGNEIRKIRPAVIITLHKYNLKTSLAIFMPITSQVKGYPFEVQIIYPQIQGVVLCDQIRSMDWQARRAEKICSLEKSKLNEIIAKFKLLLID